jgi:hypothetical protein
MGRVLIVTVAAIKSEMDPKNELSEGLEAQVLLYQRLRSSIKTLEEVENLLKVIEANLKYSNECNDALRQENCKLKLACDKWMKRAINLEFKVLNARDGK